jgi:hypothetical protein
MLDRTTPIAHVLPVPERPGRRVVVLHPALAARYTSLVAAVAGDVEARLDRRVLANRVVSHSVEPPMLRLAPWRAERDGFARRLAGLAARAPCLVLTDVRDCYGRIGPAAVERSLLALGCAAPASRAVSRFLRGLAPHGLRGLPVGPDASAVLANAVLSRLDAALRAAGVEHLRWVDAVVAFAEGPADARAVLGLVDAALARIGLERHEGKTRVLTDPGAEPLAVSLSATRTRLPVG